MRTVGHLWFDDWRDAEGACNKLIAVGVRIININNVDNEFHPGVMVWFEHELAFDEDWVYKVVSDEKESCERGRSMRKIETHQVGGVNERLQIEVRDEPGPGGACHVYVVSEDTEAESTMPSYTIKFQKGPIKESGLNGMTQEVLLAIVADRLEGFQSGDFACELNQVALDHVLKALAALQQRTLDRISRNVEGTSE